VKIYPWSNTTHDNVQQQQQPPEGYYVGGGTPFGRTQQHCRNSTICSIIDHKAGPILREIRHKVVLGPHALIIPSDVHNHLVDRKILRQKHFSGAAGGNIMDRAHYGEFLRLLALGEDGKSGANKAAATLFFQEHVNMLFPIESCI
jgi:hypothetical protein